MGLAFDVWYGMVCIRSCADGAYEGGLAGISEHFPGYHSATTDPLGMSMGVPYCMISCFAWAFVASSVCFDSDGMDAVSLAA